MNDIIWKYRINDYLDKLTVKEYKAAIKIIPQVLDVSVNTFHNYRRIKIRDVQDIPYEIVRMLEILLEVKPGELENFKVSGESLKTLMKKGKY